MRMLIITLLFLFPLYSFSERPKFSGIDNDFIKYTCGQISIRELRIFLEETKMKPEYRNDKSPKGALQMMMYRQARTGCTEALESIRDIFNLSFKALQRERERQMSKVE